MEYDILKNPMYKMIYFVHHYSVYGHDRIQLFVKLEFICGSRYEVPLGQYCRGFTNLYEVPSRRNVYEVPSRQFQSHFLIRGSIGIILPWFHYFIRGPITPEFIRGPITPVSITFYDTRFHYSRFVAFVVGLREKDFNIIWASRCSFIINQKKDFEKSRDTRFHQNTVVWQCHV